MIHIAITIYSHNLLEIMNKRELVKILEKFDDYDTVIISDGIGWSNIEKVQKSNDYTISIIQEKYPVFSD